MFRKILALKIFDRIRTLSPRARQVILLNSIYAFVGTIGGLFVNIFIWKVTSSLRSVAIFNFFIYLALLTAYLITGPVFRGKAISFLYRLSFFVFFCFYLALLILKGKASLYLPILGFTTGLGAGFYWAAQNTMVFIGTKDENRDLFFGTLGSIVSVVSAVAPLIAGAIIWLTGRALGGEFTGYYLVFGFLSLILLASEFVIKKTTGVSFEIYRFWEMLKLPLKNPTWRLQFIRSMIDGLLLVSVLLYSVFSILVLKTEISVGFWIGVITIFAALSSIIFGHIYKPGKRVTLGLVGALAAMAGDIILAWQVNPVGFLVGRFLKEVLGYPLITITWLSFFYLTIDRDKEGKARIFEFLVSNDLALAIGRLTSIGLFLILLDTYSQINTARVWYIVVSILYLITWLYIKKVREKLVADGYNS